MRAPAWDRRACMVEAACVCCSQLARKIIGEAKQIFTSQSLEESQNDGL